ncbi:3-hydroxyacyl-[acyl-carrier-protein] dehydratase [Tistlia consotensis]|uniref:3-hydroxyacyl-[acyl-carrier-protein] dehydratase FabZ n=1 Tax=Tistlia consotensis USBA 355 TaxID=560819 RepID=A0A1Y6CRG8_9PROT|nr:3-hydroxyacyl-ACP dehydratase FabZ [Tistlia consotensis]SMF70571.1 3-hydroxyacyl-[acyl-carrier-protein] dehydratase [Tistlia consotensis USBA 355]SNS04697.1 3-hydroxyacyl-[acyl-carrier-protein] dehydratase [Tistlia consotensis]
MNESSAPLSETAGKELGAADILGIMRMIPHRYPFLMIDRVVEIELDVRAVGIKNVSINEPHFQGHFPRQPVMPGVLIVESMAQTAAVLVVETLEGAAAGKLVYFMSVDEARFRKPIFPGDQVRVEVSKLKNRGPVWKFRGEAKVDGRLMAEAVFTAMIMDD